jgi:hypothetical protein
MSTISGRRAKVNAAKLEAAILTALHGVKRGNLTMAEVTGEVAKVMGRETADIEGAIRTQSNNTSSSPAKRDFFKTVASKVKFQTISVGGQGAPRDNTDYAAALSELESLLG